MIEVLRYVVVGLAVFAAGSTAVVAARYIWAAYKLGRAPGAILARHVAEVSAGTCGLVSGYAIGTYAQLGGAELLAPMARTWLYLVSMTLLVIGVVEVGRHQRRKQPQNGRHHRQS